MTEGRKRTEPIGIRPKTLKQGLILIVLAALVPFALVSLLQGATVLQNTRILVAGRLSSVATAIAERERDPFIIARHSLTIASKLPEVIAMTPDCSSALAPAVAPLTGVINFVRSDASATPRCSVKPFDTELDYSGTRWWRDGIGQNSFSVSDPIFGQISKQPVIVVMLPMTKPDGTQDGAVTAAISLERVQRSLDTAVKGHNAIAAIVSENGDTLLSSSSRQLGKPDISGNAGPLATLQAKDGSQWIYAVTPLERGDLYVLYAEPREVIMTPSLRQMQVSVLLPLIAMLFASLAIWFATNRMVVRWLRRLGGLANQFAGGNFAGNEYLFAKAPEEVVSLSDDLHSMARAIEARDDELKSALAIKTELTREVHHRVKNNLQIVMSLLTLQESQIEDSHAQGTLSQTRVRIAALALIHRLLYQQEDSDIGVNHIGIDNLMGELCTQLRTANRGRHNIDLKCDIVTHSIEVDHAVPLALFTVEAVTNAYAHAFDNDGAGLIKLTFEIEDGEAVLIIADDGRGYDIDASATRMGSDLMTAFADQVRGKASIESAPGAGTKITLRFPASGSHMA